MKTLTEHINESLIGAITVVTLFAVFALWSTADLFSIATKDATLFDVVKKLPKKILDFVKSTKNQKVISDITGDLYNDPDIQEFVKNPKKEGFIGLVDSKLTNDQKESLKKLNI